MSFHEMDVELNNVNSFGILSSRGNNTHELESLVGILTKVELDLACSSEKLVNLDILFIHVASRENNIETFTLEEEQKAEGSATEALEFDLLCGIFDSEVIEMESFLFVLQTKIIKVQEILSSFWQLGYAFEEMEQRFNGCEDSMKRCFEQVSEMKIHSSNFRRISFSSSQDVPYKEDKELVDLENGDPQGLNAKIKMQTAEQQRDILRMLERSLAREMDLEKKLSESRRNEEDLQLRLQQEFFCKEIEAEDMLERLFDAENRAEIHLAISKDLFLQLQTVEISMNESTQREGELERLLKDSEIKRLHASASAEASEEKQNMLECTVKDMEELIEDLKSKVLQAESQVENADAKCIILSESNAKFITEINILRHRIQHLVTSLHQAHKLKEDTAKDIRVQAKLIADLVMQLTFERERLYKQVKEVPAMYLQQIKDPPVTVSRGHNNKAEMELNSRNPTNEEMTASSATSNEADNAPGDSLTSETATGDADSSYNLNIVRNIDARQLKLKPVLMMVAVLLLVPALAAYLLQQ